MLDGNALCKPGDIVQEGQLLVSAYTDWGYKTQVSGALAEIYAQTSRKSCTILPEKTLRKVYTGGQSRSVYLILGQKRWKLCGKSGFFDGECDTMTTMHVWTLPGGFSFPAAIEITTQSDYDTVEAAVDPEAAREQMECLVKARTGEDMIAGTIEQARFTMQQCGGAYRLYASLRCEEMIARMVDAGIFKDDVNGND